MGRTRADRRNSYAKRKKKAIVRIRKWDRDSADMRVPPECSVVSLATPNRIGRMASTRTCCSCYMCGNPRRHFGEKTIQELRAEQGV